MTWPMQRIPEHMIRLAGSTFLRRMCLLLAVMLFATVPLTPGAEARADITLNETASLNVSLQSGQASEPLAAALNEIVSQQLTDYPARSEPDRPPSRAFGLMYAEGSANLIDARETAWMQQSGISWVMVQERLSASQLQYLDQAGISLYVSVPASYYTPSRLRTGHAHYTRKAEELLSHYAYNESVKGFGLLAFSNWHIDAIPTRIIQQAAGSLPGRRVFAIDTRSLSAESLRPMQSVLLYADQANRLDANLPDRVSLAGILYKPTSQVVSVRDVQELLAILNDHRELPVFFERTWFAHNSAHSSADSGFNEPYTRDLSRITAFYAGTDQGRLANPPRQPDRGIANVPLLMLLVFWIVFGLYYRINPMYRKSVIRFFANYHFFVIDVLERRIRLPVEAIVTIVLTSLLGGIMGYSVASLALDEVARQAMALYLPLFPAQWSSLFAWFWYVFVFSLLVQMLLTGWITLANYRHGQFLQIATLYSWPQHLNIIHVTVGIRLLHSFPSGILASIMVLLYFGIVLGTFFVTAYNMRRIQHTSALYMATTYALFVVVLTGVALWLVLGVDLPGGWKLAISLAEQH